MNKNLNIEDNAKILKLSYIKKNYKQLINEAQATEMSYDNFLSLMLRNEIEQRQENGIKRKIRLAKFKELRYLEDYDTSVFKADTQKQIKRNILFKSKIFNKIFNPYSKKHIPINPFVCFNLDYAFKRVFLR